MFDSAVLTSQPERRRRYLDVMEAALRAVEPRRAVLDSLALVDGQLKVQGSPVPQLPDGRIFVVGAGKAATPMAQAVESLLGDRIAAGLVVTKYGHGGASGIIEIAEAGHPVPDEQGVTAGRRILDIAQRATAKDLVIALLSGGGSALLVAPAPGLSLADLQSMTQTLLACGATINEINCLRKHCSAVSGGALARAVAPATLLTLVLSDVVGSPLDVIASGPTVPDPSTWADAWAVVTSHRLAQKLPRPVIERLNAGRAGMLAETPKVGEPLFAQSRTVVIGDNRVAARAATARGAALGFHPLLLSTFVQGEAASVAKLAVALGQEVQASGNPVAKPACLVLGGETTVTLGSQPGRGGRNQELALAAACELAEYDGITVVALATDGSDGPTDSAGGMVDGGTLIRGRAAGLSAADSLRRHDAYPFLRATGDLLITGPTQTNVNDLIFVFVE